MLLPNPNDLMILGVGYLVEWCRSQLILVRSSIGYSIMAVEDMSCPNVPAHVPRGVIRPIRLWSLRVDNIAIFTSVERNGGNATIAGVVYGE